MVQRSTFGRRGGAPSRPARPAPMARESGARTPEPAEAPPPEPYRDEELEAWKRARKRHMPWKQLSLMASLCFGVASMVLPHDVNEAVKLPLYALAGLSFFAGIRKQRS
jgi:hypothetical protein